MSRKLNQYLIGKMGNGVIVTGDKVKLTMHIHPALKKVIKGWEHRSWGDNINWIDWNSRRIYGLAPFHPKVGDEYQDRMQSGKVARFRIVEIERPGNPHDMFFATVEDVGYVDEEQP